MPDLTDSYCERCGTHYVFNPAPPKGLSLKNARMLAKGFRNFVLNDGQSWSDSLQLARHDDEHEDLTRMTEAFHKAFNFCMTCRQYACENCWNQTQGACLTCAPEPESGPVAHGSHLIVRMPVAHPEDARPVDEFYNPTFTTPAAFVSPADTPQASYPGAFGAPAPRVPPRLQPAAWPAADLAEVPPILPPDAIAAAGGDSPASASGSRPPEWLARVGSTDGETRAAQPDRSAYALWPIADPLAPEASLTPEELTLVHAQLDRDDEGVEGDAEAAGRYPEAAVEPVSATAQPVEPAASRAAPVPVPEPLSPAEHPKPDRVEDRPIVARLLDQFGQRGQAAAPVASRGRPGNGIWPYATPWAERPIKPSLPSVETQATETPSEFEPVAASLPAGAEPAPVAHEPLAPEPLAPEPATTLEAAPPEQAIAPEVTPTLQPAPAPEMAAAAPPAPEQAAEPAAPAQPVETPQAARIFAFDPVAGLAPSRTPVPPQPAQAAPIPAAPVVATPAASTAPVIRPTFAGPTPPSAKEPPAGWPPLGASWSTPQTPGSVWPAPAATPPPPAILSQQSAAAQPAPPMADMWAQSAQQVLNHGSVRVCHHCGLPVSTHARFCRRCGTSQI